MTGSGPSALRTDPGWYLSQMRGKLVAWRAAGNNMFYDALKNTMVGPKEQGEFTVSCWFSCTCNPQTHLLPFWRVVEVWACPFLRYWEQFYELAGSPLVPQMMPSLIFLFLLVLLERLSRSQRLPPSLLPQTLLVRIMNGNR